MNADRWPKSMSNDGAARGLSICGELAYNTMSLLEHDAFSAIDCNYCI